MSRKRKKTTLKLEVVSGRSVVVKQLIPARDTIITELWTRHWTELWIQIMDSWVTGITDDYEMCIASTRTRTTRARCVVRACGSYPSPMEASLALALALLLHHHDNSISTWSDSILL